MNPAIITGWPNDAIPKLKQRVRYIASKDEVAEFYIGRTNNLEAASSRHGCDKIIPIYKSTSVDNILEVEYELIKTFIHHPKCSNDANHSGGGTSEGYINYVYVAMWRGKVVPKGVYLV